MVLPTIVGPRVLTDSEAATLRAEVEEDGDTAVAARIGFSRIALARCVARFEVHAGTALLARSYLTTRRPAAA